MALDGAPGCVVEAAFAVFLLVGAGVEEPDAFKLECVALKILHFPLFSREEASPKVVLA